MPLVLFNIGWMKYYRGQTPSDRISKGGRYVTDNETGGEVENFRPLDGRCYAYGYPPGGGRVNMKRLGAKANAEYVDDVTVVFVASRPEGGSVVVGWYRHARVWREVKKRSGRRYHYYARAERKNCTLLELDERVFPVPRARSGAAWVVGRPNIRYVDEPAAEPFVRRLRKYMKDPSAPDDPGSDPAPNAPPHPDPARRIEVEKKAIGCVICHYGKIGYTCHPVERENKGWDLEFTRGAVKLLVEVKGRSGDAGRVELTPNEYKAMCNKNKRDVYRLAIVTRALDDPRLSIVSFNGSDETWRDQKHRKVRLEERTGVRISI